MRRLLSIVRLEDRLAPAVTAVGPEFRINTFTTGVQDNPAIALDADGDFVLAWQSDQQDGGGFGVFARRYSAAGTALASAFRVNSYSTNNQLLPSVASDADGDFVVVWQSADQDGNNDGIFGQRYTAAGELLGSEFQVNTFTTGSQEAPSVAMSADGAFVVAWHSFGQDGSARGVYARRYNSAGIVQGPEFRVNVFTAGDQSFADVALDADGDFVIAWQSNGQDGNLNGVYARRYQSDGTPAGGEFLVNTVTTNLQEAPSVAADFDGDFVVAWQSYGQDGGARGIYAQRYNAAGVAQGGEFPVNTFTTGNQSLPAISLDADGDFIVTWQSSGQDGAGVGVYSRLCTAAGSAVGAEFPINTTTTGDQRAVAVARDAEGDLVVAWSGAGTGDADGIYAQRFDESEDASPPLLTIVTAPELADAIEPGERLITSVSSLMVGFSEDMSVAGGGTGANSVTNPDNWELRRNGLPLAGQITGISYGFNTLTRRHEAVFSLAAPLTDGSYRLATVGSLRDLADNVLDGDFDGAPGGAFQREFQVRPVGPAGLEFRANTNTTSRQLRGAVAADADGDFVIAWQSAGQDGNNYGVYAQRYNAAGDSQGAEFRVNTVTFGPQYGPAVGMDADGDFLVAWASSDGDQEGIFGQRYNAAGAPQGGEFKVSTFTTNQQQLPTVAMDADGDFVVAWQSDLQDGSGVGIYARRYSAAGVPLDGEFRVNTFTSGEQDTPSVASDASGNFIVTWESAGQDGSNEGVYARRYNSAGSPLGAEFRVNTTTTSDQSAPSVSADADGDFVVAWQSDLQDGSGDGIYARRYSATGAPLSGEFRVSTRTTGDQSFPAVTADADGDFVVAWESILQDGSVGGIYAQRYSAAGAPLGGEFQVNTYTTDDQSRPAASMDADGDFVIAWDSDGQDGQLYGVYVQRFAAPPVPPHVQSVAVNDGSVQRSRVTSLTITFDTTVAFIGGVFNAFTLSRSGGGDVTFAATATIVGGVTVVTLDNFTGPETEDGSLRDGRYTLTALANLITANGQFLDGDNDGNPGGNFTFGDGQGLYRFYGDAAGLDRRVDISDFGFFSLAYLTPANYNPALDFNNDGRIDIADFGQFSVRYFTSLP